MLNFAILVETVVILFTTLITLYFSINTFIQKYLHSKAFTLSLVVKLYLIYQLLWSITMLIYCLYLIILWRPDEILYNQKVLYILGLPSYILMFLNSAVESVLGLDRCLCILFPLHYEKHLKRLYGILSIAVLLLFTGAVIYVNGFIDILMVDLTTKCSFFSCIFAAFNPPHVYVMKLTTLGITAAIGCVLFLLVKLYLRNTNIKDNKKMNKTIIGVIASTTIFELLPNIMAQIFTKVCVYLLISWFLLRNCSLS